MRANKTTVTRAKILLIAFTILQLTAFVQPAKADLDPQGLSATVLTGVGALSVFMGLATGTALAVTGGVPLAVLGTILYITNETSPSSASTSTGLHITLDPNKPLITPVGWSSPTTPPNTINKSQGTWNNQISGGFTSSESAINAHIAVRSQQNPTWQITPNYTLTRVLPDNDVNNDYFDNTYSVFNTSTQTTFTQTFRLTVQTFCPSGSTQATADTCTVTNPAQIPKPKKGIMEIKRTGNTFAIDPQANAADILPSSIVNVTPTEVTVNDSNGSVTKVKINTDGTSTITTSQPDTSTGKTNTTTTQLSAPSGGNPPQVIGTAQGSVDGTGSLQGSGSGSEIDVSGLNQEGTQGQVLSTLQDIKNSQCGGTGQPPCQTIIDETGVETVIAETETSHTSRLGTIDGLFDEIEDIAQNQTEGVGTGFSTPITNLIPSSGSCVNPSFDATSIHPSASVTLPLCEHAQDVQPLLTWVASMYTIFAIWGLMFTKVGGT